MYSGEGDYEDMNDGIEKALKNVGCTSAMLSKIRMYREHCITKEKYEEMYKTNEESDKRMDLSVGEDLESFIEKIKTEKIKDTIPESGDRSKSFLLCLLDKDERKKLEQKDENFRKLFESHQWGHREVDVSEAEWEASESNLKFAKSVCWRETYLIDA